MNQLIVLHGLPGSGKSTWIKEHNLQDYTISMDNLRLMFSAPVLQVNSSFGISQKHNNIVAKTFMEILETRMKNGSFTIIDATNYRNDTLKNYKKLAEKYRYRILLVDFNLPLEKVIEQNELRKDTYKYVFPDVIKSMNARNIHIPSSFTKINYMDDQGLNDFIIRRKRNINEYESLVVIGDIHGCYSALMNLSFEDNKFYVFVGDYFDKGLENVKVFNWIYEHINDTNKLFLIGNHELHINQYINDEYIDEKTNFVKHTLPEFEKAGITKKDLKRFYYRLQQMAYISFNEKTYLITHGGISNIDLNKLAFINTRDFIYGVGNYPDMERITKKFNSCIQIFGHRNLTNLPIQINKYNICLEGHVESLFDETGRLRVVEFTKDTTIYHELKNPLWCKGLDETKIDLDVAKYLESVKDSSIIYETKQGELLNPLRLIPRKFNFYNLSSFNFTKEAFYKKAWNDLSIKARGLFIDTKEYKVVARSYDKFFNIDELESTKLENLSMEFPVTAYKKENGYLGILSVYQDNLLFCSKSRIEDVNGFAYQFHRCFNEYHIDEEQLKNFLLENNCSMIFEVIKPDFDIHMIEYNKNKLVLLDIIDNKLKTNLWTYDKLITVAKMFGLPVKEKLYEFTSYNEFVQFIDKERNTMNNKIEGYVFVDSNYFMVKYKTVYYQFWKAIRSLLEQEVFPKNPRFIGMFDKSIAKEVSLEYKEVKKFFDEYSKKDNWKERIVYRRFIGDEINVIAFRKLYEETKMVK